MKITIREALQYYLVLQLNGDYFGLNDNEIIEKFKIDIYEYQNAIRKCNGDIGWSFISYENKIDCQKFIESYLIKTLFNKQIY